MTIYSYAAAMIAVAAFSTHASQPNVALPRMETSKSSVTSTAPDTVRLKVDGMTCGGCAVSARIVLRRLAGVVNAQVDYDTKVAVVVFDPKIVSPERMIQALKEKLNYSATVLPPKDIEK